MEPSPLDPPSSESSSDPFSGYLEVVSVLGALHAKRGRLIRTIEEQMQGDADVQGEDVLSEHVTAEMVARVDAGIREAEALCEEYELRIENGLQFAANRADAVRALFNTVTQRMKEMEQWILESVENLPDEDREEWELLVSDYERIREELGGEP